MTREEKAALLETAQEEGTWSLDRLSEQTLDKIIEDAQIDTSEG